MSLENESSIRIEKINIEIIRVLTGLKKPSSFRSPGYSEYIPPAPYTETPVSEVEEQLLRARLLEANTALANSVSELFGILFSCSLVQSNVDPTDNFSHFLEYYRNVIKVMEEVKFICMTASIGGRSQFRRPPSSPGELHPVLKEIEPSLLAIGFLLQFP